MGCYHPSAVLVWSNNSNTNGSNGIISCFGPTNYDFILERGRRILDDLDLDKA